jgi:hypothetical protein
LLDLKTALAGAIAAMLLTSCTKPLFLPNPPPPNPFLPAHDNAQTPPSNASIEARIQPYVGNFYWVTEAHHLTVCQDQAGRIGCASRSGHFKVEGFAVVPGGYVALQVTFDYRPTGWVTGFPDLIAVNFLTYEPVTPPGAYPTFLDKLPKKVADERRKLPGVKPGMTEEEVLHSAWGPPLSKKMMARKRGIREEWHYPHGNALYFENGILDGFDK